MHADTMLPLDRSSITAYGAGYRHAMCSTRTVRQHDTAMAAGSNGIHCVVLQLASWPRCQWEHAAMPRMSSVTNDEWTLVRARLLWGRHAATSLCTCNRTAVSNAKVLVRVVKHRWCTWSKTALRSKIHRLICSNGMDNNSVGRVDSS
jgi:hypothetical protein